MRIEPNPNALPSGAVNEGTQLQQATLCTVTGRSSDPEGFIATGRIDPETDRPIYVSIAAIREMARLVGLVDAEVYSEAIAEQERLTDELKEQVAEAVELEKARLLVATADKE